MVATTARRLQPNLPKIAMSCSQASAPQQSAVPAKFEQLETRVTELAAQVAQSQVDTNASFAEVQSTLQAVEEKVLVQESQFDTKVEAMFAKLMANQQSCFGQLEKSNAKAISELRTEYVSGYNELKEILSNSPKSRRVAEAVP